MTDTTWPAACCHQARLTALSEARWAALHAGTAADLTGIIDSLIHQTKEKEQA